ncbi:hypothetical protein Tco_1414563 [Tanacetum coccineum]
MCRCIYSICIISDSDDEITTLPIRPAPLSLDRTSTLYGYPLDSGDDSSDEDLNDTAESLHTQSASAPVVHPSPTRSLSTSLVLAKLLSSSRRRSRPLLPSLPPSVPPSPEHVESVRDNIEASIWNLEKNLGP